MSFTPETEIFELYFKGAISTHTYNCLSDAGMETIASIVRSIRTAEDLMNLPGFGLKSLREMEAVLGAMESGTEGSAETENLPISHRLPALGQKMDEIISGAHSEVCGSGTVGAELLAREFPASGALHSLMMGLPREMLRVRDGQSRQEALEMRQALMQFISRALEKMEEAGLAESRVHEEYLSKRLALEAGMETFTRRDTALHFLTPQVRDFLEDTYWDMARTFLSIRGQHFLAMKAPHHTDLLEYLDQPLVAYHSLCPGQNMRKTLKEVFLFSQKFREAFDRISGLSDNQVQVERIQRTFPGLMEEDVRFVSDFILSHGHAPALFLALHHVRTSKRRPLQIYGLIHGIQDGIQRTMLQVAETLGHTRERIRQLALEALRNEDPLLSPIRQEDCYRALFLLPFLHEKTEEYVRRSRQEHLGDDFGIFASLMVLLGPFMKVTIGGHVILLSHQAHDQGVERSLKTLEDLMNEKHSTQTSCPMDTLLYHMSQELRPAAEEILGFAATEIFHGQVTEDRQILIPQNCIDPSEELYGILSREGRPMHVQELFRAFKAIYPDHKFTDPGQIRPYLYGHEHIRAIGKSSHYALDSWEDVYFGSIRDLLAKTLEASEVPLHIDTLLEAVTRHYPNTNKNNLSASMSDAHSRKFVAFQGGYFGLTSKVYSPDFQLAPTAHRLDFSQRLALFRAFVDSQHRFPFIDGGEQERSLANWFYNVTHDVLATTDESVGQIQEMVAHYSRLGYPSSITEYKFQVRCEQVKAYYRQNHSLPTLQTAPGLYHWLHSSLRRRDRYTDKRQEYLAGLLEFLNSFV